MAESLKDFIQNNKIGQMRSALKLEPDTPIQKVLASFAQTQIERSIEALVNGNPSHEATGSLAQSISFKINFNNSISRDNCICD